MFDVDEAVESVVLSHQARSRPVTWEPGRGVRAYGDPDDLAEVVDILLENGARHGRGAPLTLSTTVRDGMVELVYRDEGPGIHPAVRATLFDPGRRGPDSGGQGLGLGIARRLMRRLGGDLVVPDTGPAPCPGATFVALLPCSEVSRGVRDRIS